MAKAVRLDPEHLEAVVIDTNSQPNGRPDTSALEELVEELAGDDIAVVLPEVVAWEFAEHVASDYAAAENAYKPLAKTLRRAGIEISALPSRTREDVQDEVLTLLEDLDGITILPLQGDHARDAVRDQVLQRGAGSTEGGVKTGAADSAWLRTIRGRWPDPKSVVIVSGDKGARTAAAELWSSSPTFVKDLWHLRQALFVHPADPQSVTAELVEFMALAAGADQYEWPVDLGDVTLPDDVLEALFGSEATYGFVQLDVTLEALGPLVGVREVVASKVTGAIAAEVFVAARFDVVAWSLDNDGQLTSDIATLYDAVVAAEVVFRRRESKIVYGAVEGNVRVLGGKALYGESTDAADDFFAALGVFPGMPDIDAPPIGEPLELEVPGMDLVLAFDWVDDGWEAELGVPGSPAAVLRCEYDPNARVWDGADGFDFEGPYRVVSENAPLAWNPLWSLNAYLAIHGAPGVLG